MLSDLQRIEHMIENANALLTFVANLSETEYAASIEKQYAVKFAFIMLGEDAASISDALKQKYPDIPWRQIKNMRNTVAHDYVKTEEEIIWETIVKDIEPLYQRLVQLRSEL
ncbi:MAG: DUF86 domain-containing protein [Victivallales bacterium]|jgi:uncharacterized protein with HEPN domain|nr:DUF86 domain-containing protein [Victivallales bacterium]